MSHFLLPATTAYQAGQEKIKVAGPCDSLTCAREAGRKLGQP
jgi:hypothetical protein